MYVCTYIHTYIHTYTHARTYIHFNSPLLRPMSVTVQLETDRAGERVERGKGGGGGGKSGWMLNVE